MKYIFMLSSILIFFTATLYANEEDRVSSAVVFMYHHFGKSKYPSTNIKLEQFKKQLDYLEAHHYNVWPLSKILRYVKNRRGLPSKTVGITIDDAYISTYTHAYPMLKKRNFPFTVFVNTNPIGHNSVNYMTWEHMKEMKLYGAEFANHSSTHDYLTPKKNERKVEWQKRIKREIEDAQRILHRELGQTTNEKPKVLSYPFGEYTQESADFIQRLGYIGVAQTSGVLSYDSDLRRVPRYAMSEAFADMDGFTLKLQTLALEVESAQPWDPVVVMNPPRLKIKLKNSMKSLGCYTSNGKAIKIEWISDVEFEAEATSPLQGVRDRYTCTAQDYSGKWHWYSHLWILKKK
ncbi:MAG: biofilm PGA synthesis lipoprotein PgaB [Sulfurimonas sp.]|jgi:biofilm PGA synthesis lipoprotein PgaB|uniref:polysaccharide deacetylase family protein n=1 Tax=Sulfurimonas sp. TaxID=2022749 RepID=UPI0039E6D7C3